MSTINEQRILALDVHPQVFGFVVFESSCLVLDWGAKSFRGGVNRVRVPLRDKLFGLIDTYKPDVLVMQKPKTEKLRRLVEKIEAQAQLQKVRTRLVHPVAVHRVFAGMRNKDQVASAIAERFPELSSALPPRRRVWQSEKYGMSIFDAAALALAYYGVVVRKSGSDTCVSDEKK